MNIDELIAKSHSIAIAQGWWPDGPGGVSVCVLVNLFHSEISEAWVDWRACRMELWWSLDGARVHPTDTTREAQDNWGVWRPAKPEGFWVEIADLVLRLADTMGAMGWKYDPTADWKHFDDMPSFVSTLHVWSSALFRWDMTCYRSDANVTMANMIKTCVRTAERHGVDLLELCELKMQYNATRPYRHGGKRA